MKPPILGACARTVSGRPCLGPLLIIAPLLHGSTWACKESNLARSREGITRAGLLEGTLIRPSDSFPDQKYLAFHPGKAASPAQHSHFPDGGSLSPDWEACDDWGDNATISVFFRIIGDCHCLYVVLLRGGSNGKWCPRIPWKSGHAIWKAFRGGQPE